MITGVVTERREAIIRVKVRGPAGQDQEIEAVIDTGFDGWLSLPPSRVAQLGLVWHRRGRALLADGNESVFDIYEATVEWDGQLRRIPVDEAETFPLVGMSLWKATNLLFKSKLVGMSLCELCRKQEVANHRIEKAAVDRASHPKR